jgi:hypothetical protein
MTQRRSVHLGVSIFSAASILLVLTMQLVAVGLLATNWQRIETTWTSLDSAVEKVASTDTGALMVSAISEIEWNKTEIYTLFMQEQQRLLKKLDEIETKLDAQTLPPKPLPKPPPM